MQDRREHQRIPLRVNIKIAHPQFGEKVVATKNFSEGGLFIIVKPTDLPSPGAIVKGQIQGLAEEAPIVEMRIVRVENDGVGLQYIIND
ncbi:MAG TPA: PilZ domain-containing protein [Cellvibrionaceae bacterium]